LTGNRATDGARVILGAGTFYQAKITAAWSANALPAESGNEMVIEGAGNTTILRVYDAQPKLLAQNANGGPVQFRELWINDHQPAAFVTDIAEFSDDTEGTVSLENVRLGWDGSALKGPRVT
jgi:hypothetical protein